MVTMSWSLPRSRPALFAASTVTMMALVLAPSGGEAAYAHGEPLEYSRDGYTWSVTPPDALFDDGIVLVPGGSATRTLHLRNRAAETGSLELSFENVEASDVVAGDTFGVTVESSSGHGKGGTRERHRVSDLGEGAPESPRLLVDPGEILSLTVTVDLDPDATGKVAQNSTIRLDLAIQFADARAVGDESDPVTPPQVIPVLPPSGDDPSGHSGGIAAPAAPATPGGTAAPSPSSASAPSGAPAVPGAAAHEVAERTSSTAAGETTAGAAAPGRLAVTGFTAGALGALAAVLIGGGIALLRSRRRQEPS